MRFWLGSIGLLGALAGASMASAATDPLAPTGHWTASTRGAAKTPPMGWNSWNAFRTDVDEAKVMGAAQALLDTGLARLGYRYVNLDDGWWLKRRTSDGRLQVRTATFPSARIAGPEGSSFRAYTDRLHAMGLKAGIYTDLGRNACGQAFDLNSPTLPAGTRSEREVGLYGHIDQDIRLFFKDWGFDYIKVDACGLADYAPGNPILAAHDYRAFPPLIERGNLARTDSAAVRALFGKVAAALDRYDPDGDYVFSICPWGEADVRAWGKDVANSWRASGDITPEWTRMLHTFDSVATRSLYAGPGHWNDPDMLEIGHGDFDEKHLTEARTHFSLWAIESAPLLIGYDLRKAPRSLLDIFGNADVIAVDQDPSGNQGVIAYQSDDVQIIVKTLADPHRKAVVLFNRGLRDLEATLTAAHLKFAAGKPIAIKDLWSKTNSSFTGDTTFHLAPRQSVMLIATGERALPDGVYLSEAPASINVAVDGVARPETDPTIHQMVSPWGGTRSSGERTSYGGWGGAQADAAPYGTQIEVAGSKFDTGIGVLADSRLEVRNSGNFTAFAASVGVDDASRNPGANVRFAVYADGKLVAQTPAMKLGDAPAAIRASVAGAKIVELVARQTGTGPRASVAWANAALSR